jgi:hypothetical protein
VRTYPARSAPVLVATIIAAISIGLSLWLGAPDDTRLSEDEIKALAADSHVVIGDVRLTLPTFAVPDLVSMGAFFAVDRSAARRDFKERRAALRAASSDRTNPLRLDIMQIKLDRIMSDDFGEGLSRICGKLATEWARSVCGRPWDVSNSALPRKRFDLADMRRLDVFQSRWTVGMETVHSQLRSMTLRHDAVSVACDAKSSGDRRFCTAAMPLRGHMIAVWTVFEDAEEAAQSRAYRDGRDISDFVAMIARTGG